MAQKRSCQCEHDTELNPGWTRKTGEDKLVHEPPPYGNLSYNYLVEHYGTIDFVWELDDPADGFVSWNNVPLTDEDGRPYVPDWGELVTAPHQFKYVMDTSLGRV
ncbi:MAG: hypothetical protein KGL39_46435 [Patescibacteria group bacterium]|nr:hypothetical protein [Patescibacteria group bacterium]